MRMVGAGHRGSVPVYHQILHCRAQLPQCFIDVGYRKTRTVSNGQHFPFELLNISYSADNYKDYGPVLVQ